MFTWIYRLMENIDGERKYKFISYQTATRIKMVCLMFIR